MIYYVEDDSSIRELVLYTLKTTCFEAKGFESGEGLFAELSAGNTPELLLLDIMLPGEDGMEIMKRFKRGGFDFPVIMVTAKNSEYDKVTGLDCGADDYIAKPFGMMELIARIKAVLRRSERSKSDLTGNILSCGSVELDARSHIVTVDGVPAELTLKEFELLRILLKNKNAVLTRDTLLESIWGYDCAGETRAAERRYPLKRPLTAVFLKSRTTASALPPSITKGYSSASIVPTIATPRKRAARDWGFPLSSTAPLSTAV